MAAMALAVVARYVCVSLCDGMMLAGVECLSHLLASIYFSSVFGCLTTAVARCGRFDGADGMRERE